MNLVNIYRIKSLSKNTPKHIFVIKINKYTQYVNQNESYPTQKKLKFVVCARTKHQK